MANSTDYKTTKNGITIVTSDDTLVNYKHCIHDMRVRDYKFSSEIELPNAEQYSYLRENAKGETHLHYQLVEYVRNHERYKNMVKILPGLGEHLATNHASKDAWLKGYECGIPDLTLVSRRKNGNPDVLCIELKWGKGKLSDKQVKYHSEIKEACNITVHVVYTFEEAKQIIEDHYKRIDEEDDLLATKMTDMEQRIKELEQENKDLKEQNQLLALIAKTSSLSKKIIDIANILR